MLSIFPTPFGAPFPFQPVLSLLPAAFRVLTHGKAEGLVFPLHLRVCRNYCLRGQALSPSSVSGGSPAATSEVSAKTSDQLAAALSLNQALELRLAQLQEQNMQLKRLVVRHGVLGT